MDKGHIRLYTGDGKGKTTMALGLALRFAGAGKRVFIGQFIKDDPRGDIMALRKAIPGVVTAAEPAVSAGANRTQRILTAPKKVLPEQNRRFAAQASVLWCLTKLQFPCISD